MSHLERQQKYLEIICQFFTSELDAEDFCREFMSAWRTFRDEEYAKAEAWPKRYDLGLIEAYGRGELLPEEFERRWVELWGYGEYRHLVEMADQIFTACDVFAPSPTREHEIDEAELINVVRARLADYESAKANHHP